MRRPPVTRSAATLDEPPCPGASTNTSSWSAARSSGRGPQHLAVWVKPWTSTSRAPRPVVSTWSDGEGFSSATVRTLGFPPMVEPAPVTDAATFCATVVDEWVRGGITDVVVAPGSRSTPMALAMAADGRLRVHVHHDERSAGFLALGLATATGRPAP